MILTFCTWTFCTLISGQGAESVFAGWKWLKSVNLPAKEGAGCVEFWEVQSAKSTLQGAESRGYVAYARDIPHIIKCNKCRK
jgi:hypothetical protein